MMKISLILEAVNRVTGPMRAVVKAVEQVGTAAAATARRVRASMAGMYDFTRDAAAHFRLLAGEEGMGRAARSADYLKRQVSGLTGGLTLLKYASIGAGIGLAEEFVRGVFTAGGEMQRMEVTLTRLEGSAAKARASLNWMQTFAMGPGANFSMPDILRAYQMAKNFGMNPQGGSLASFADLAAGERVPLKQVLYAVKDAMEGTSVRPLANLGIKMKQGHGKNPTNSYLYSDGEGKFHTETSAKTPEAVMEKLVQIINSKYAGLATAQAKTVPGAIEQLKKLLFMFQAKVAGAGVFDWALARLNQLFAFIRRASADGSLDALARRISRMMTTAGDRIIDFATQTDWRAVGRDLALLAGMLMLVARAVGLVAKLGGGGLHGLFNVWLATKIIGVTYALAGFWPVLRAGWTILTGLIPIIWEFAASLLGIAIAGGPITLIILGLAALVAAGYLLARNWDKVSSWFSAAWGRMRDGVASAWASIVDTVRSSVAKVGGLIPAWMRPLLRAAGAGAGMVLGLPIAPAGPRPGPPRPAPPRPPAAGAAGRDGKLTIEFVGDPGPTKIRQIRATGREDIVIKRGPIMAGSR